MKTKRFLKDFFAKFPNSHIRFEGLRLEHMYFGVQLPMYKKKLITFEKTEEGHFRYKLSEEGKKCHILQFLINTSNFTWYKEKEHLPEEYFENNTHLISKLCAIGYMMLRTFWKVNNRRDVQKADEYCSCERKRSIIYYD